MHRKEPSSTMVQYSSYLREDKTYTTACSTKTVFRAPNLQPAHRPQTAPPPPPLRKTTSASEGADFARNRRTESEPRSCLAKSAEKSAPSQFAAWSTRGSKGSELVLSPDMMVSQQKSRKKFSTPAIKCTDCFYYLLLQRQLRTTTRKLTLLRSPDSPKFASQKYSWKTTGVNSLPDSLAYIFLI